MTDNIRIIEKPEWVTWSEISAALWQAHGSNRENGINMKHASFSGEEIEDYLQPNGKMFVALLDNKLVGFSAYKPKKVSFWFGEGLFAYRCFEAVLPQYTGKGIYGRLVRTIEDLAYSQGIDKVMFNTHPKNHRVVQSAQQNGYKLVDYRAGKDNPWVYMVKWIDGCPYSNIRCVWMYYKQRLLTKLKQKIKLFIRIR